MEAKLQGKTVVVAVSGSIAAYKAPNIVRMCKKMGADVEVLMTRNATQFINPITFESLTGHKCLVDTFDRNFEFSVEHVALAKRADVVLLAPASANVIGKIAWGIADDMLTTTMMACTCPKIIAPAMNHNMFHNPIVQDNLKRLSEFGYEIVTPAHGMLANGDMGDGRMPEESLLVEYILRAIACEKDLAGKHILVTAGPTREAIDPVRFISNRSTGKMGYAIARAARDRGAQVTLVTGPVSIQPPAFVEVVPVESAEEMYQAVMARAETQDMIIKTAAVADYRPETVAEEKIKKSEDDMSISLVRTRDILGALGASRKAGQVICGFSMETEHMLENAQGKLKKKHVDMIVANNVKDAGAGFGVDTNLVTIVTEKGAEKLPLMSKDQVAHAILDRMKDL
jgi:phosphopantothenoylcysteine decarboxylase/phosphopantothenate--cysteine ligase